MKIFILPFGTSLIVTMDQPGAFATKCWAAINNKDPLMPHTINRRPVGPKDVHIKIKWAGICHSDIHQVREDWGPSIFPMVPGHEIAGIVAAVGANVSKFKVGDHAGVGCFVDCCRRCDKCQAGTEQYCRNGMVMTYNGRCCHPHVPGYNKDDPSNSEVTYGGYSQDIVVDENFVIHLPKNLPLDAAAPLLCAGITVFSPMQYYGVKKGEKLAVAGLGGLGSMAVKFGKAMGCHVTVISRGTKKKAEAMDVLKADDYIDVNDDDQVNAAADRFAHIVDTIAAAHDINRYLGMVDIDGQLIVVGAPPEPLPLSTFSCIFKRKSIVGSLIGGIKETQEMIDFCAEHDIVCEVEKIKPEYINEAYERTMKADVKYRFSIDVSQM